MNSISSVAQSGLQAAQTRLNTAAHNIANVNTENFTRQVALQQTLPDGGVAVVLGSQQSVQGSSLEGDVVQQMLASYSYRANLQTITSQQRMTDALHDATARDS